MYDTSISRSHSRRIIDFFCPVRIHFHLLSLRCYSPSLVFATCQKCISFISFTQSIKPSFYFCFPLYCSFPYLLLLLSHQLTALDPVFFSLCVSFYLFIQYSSASLLWCFFRSPFLHCNFPLLFSIFPATTSLRPWMFFIFPLSTPVCLFILPTDSIFHWLVFWSLDLVFPALSFAALNALMLLLLFYFKMQGMSRSSCEFNHRHLDYRHQWDHLYHHHLFKLKINKTKKNGENEEWDAEYKQTRTNGKQ